MGHILEMTDLGLQQPFRVFKADSGGITFCTNKQPLWSWEISLICKECPHKTLYEINVNFSHITLKKDGEEKKSKETIDPLSNVNGSQKCWLTWHNDTIQLGIKESYKHLAPLFVYEEETFTERNPKSLIGFVRFSSENCVDFIVETSPVFLKPISLKNIKEGQLRWVKMTDDKLPPDVLIGGFENEPLYIIRALHGRSMCPGKYVASKKKASVPWGHIEHTKKVFEILCGFNAMWVKCKDNLIPENVFKAGTSEVQGEDVYVGRAMIDDNLVVGKVHMLYKTCYLPYKGKEVEKHTYEILVRGDMRTYGYTTNKNCSLNPLKALQPCI